jgi:iron complex transport system permease protein
MHLEQGEIPAFYRFYLKRKKLALLAGGAAMALLFLLALGLGSVQIDAVELIRTLAGSGADRRAALVVWNIRLPQAITAVVAGVGLSLSGAVMQTVLKNPLGSPFTLGVSHAAAFGAALAVMFFGGGRMGSTPSDAVLLSNLPVTTVSAFACSLLATGVVILLSRSRGATPESMVLSGVALGSLFTAATLLLQYFAEDSQLAAMVFWSFGDLARTRWPEVAAMSVTVGLAAFFFLWNRWNYNALDAGAETAASLGVRVNRVRLAGLLVSSLVTSVIVAFCGVIGFIGLLGPHMTRRLLGDDHRFLLPGSALAGALILLAADTAARTALSPRTLPVSIVTSFLGAPLFLWMIVRGTRR